MSKFKIKVTRSKDLVQNEGLFMKYLCVKYQNPIPHGSKDITQVKGFSLRCDADTGVMTIALRTVVLAS
jgi:hypothetical protein